MLKQEFTFEGSNRKPYTLNGVLWTPENKEVDRIIHVFHGMTEHIGRYEIFAEAMTKQGIAVAGFDLRGHGKNLGDPDCASFGEGGWACALEDMEIFSNMLYGKYPAAKHYVLGFSLGSFLLREYLMQENDNKISGAIIMGTGDQPAMILKAIIAVVKGEIKKAGWDQTTPLVQSLSFETYNKKFKPNRTHSDWLCSDENELDSYIGDHLCRKDISAGLFADLLASMERTGEKKAYAKYRKDLPILLISGIEDSVGNFGKGVQTVYTQMKKNGVQDIQIKLYEGARHDLLHEEASGVANQVREMIAGWILEHGN